MSEDNEGHKGAERRDEAEEMARLQEQINNLPVSQHILFMMHSLSSLAVDRLGLATEGGDRLDVAQGRLAIDAFKALLGVLEEAMPTEEVAAHRGVLSQLQLAYVGVLGDATSAAEAKPEDSATEDSAADSSTEEAAADEGDTPKSTAKSRSRAGTGKSRASRGAKASGGKAASEGKSTGDE